MGLKSKAAVQAPTEGAVAAGAEAPNDKLFEDTLFKKTVRASKKQRGLQNKQWELQKNNEGFKKKHVYMEKLRI